MRYFMRLENEPGATQNYAYQKAAHYFRFVGFDHHAGEFQNYLDYFADSLNRSLSPKPDALEGLRTVAVLMVIPSVQNLVSSTWALLEQHPGRVLYSYFHGLASWRGVWTNRAASFFGGEPQNRYGLPETAPQKLIINGHEFPFERHADPFISTPLLITPTSAEVLGYDDQQRPMWLRLEQRDMLLFPLEALSEDPSTVENIYRAILK